jgi:hypothetical protein
MSVPEILTPLIPEIHLNLEGVLPVAAERARISGIDVPEFPEPKIHQFYKPLTPI